MGEPRGADRDAGVRVGTVRRAGSARGRRRGDGRTCDRAGGDGIDGRGCRAHRALARLGVRKGQEAARGAGPRRVRRTAMTDVDYEVTDRGVAHEVRDLNLADEGRRRTDWAERQMPVLRGIRERFERERPLAGVRIAIGLHITTETAVLLRTLRAGGAELALCASNPLSTRDDVSATLVVHEQIPVFAHYGEDVESSYRRVSAVLDRHPHLVIDDGADLIVKLHERPVVGDMFGGLEETTTGVVRVRAMARQRILRFPVVAVNDTPTKRFFDNRYGTGQNTVDGILRATNVLL